MTITPPARELLNRLLAGTPGAIGLIFQGAVGSCRAAVPLLQPVTAPPDGLTLYTVNDLRFYVPDNYSRVFADATLDFERGLFSRGLNLTWPHRDGGCPNCQFDR